MHKKISIFFISLALIFFSLSSFAQVKKDSTIVPLNDSAKSLPFLIGHHHLMHRDSSLAPIAPQDSSRLLSMDPKVSHTTKKFSPRLATIRSAMIPGWGQAYNHKYWKIPFIYAALGTTAGIFIYNLKNYNQFKKAYRQSVADSTIPIADDPRIDASLRVYTQADLLANRNIFRQNIDYSALFFILFWGLNVVDATVDAHLKTFDVSDDISLEFKPGYSEMANTNGISFVMKIGKRY